MATYALRRIVLIAGFCLATLMLFLSSGDASAEGDPILVAPVPPNQTEVCGINNDLLEFREQPVGVKTPPGESPWVDGHRTIWYTPEAGYYFDGPQIVYFNFADSGPCTVPITPPVQVQICGPNNDTVTIPGLAAPVTIGSDTGWSNDKRTITFTIGAGYVTHDQKVYELTDINEPCPTSTLTPDPSPSPSITPDPSPSPSSTPDPSPSPSITPDPSSSPSATSIVTPTTDPNASPSATGTVLPGSSPTPGEPVVERLPNTGVGTSARSSFLVASVFVVVLIGIAGSRDRMRSR